MGFLFALLLMGLPLAAFYVDMNQARGSGGAGSLDFTKGGGYTPRLHRNAIGAAPVAPSAPVAPAAPPASTLLPPASTQPPPAV